MLGTSERSEPFVAMQPVPEARSWAEKVATRLWMLQASFADDPPDARHDYLVEEIERSLKEVSASRRSEYLGALMERFPGPERIDAPYFRPPPVEQTSKSAQEIADELVLRAGAIVYDFDRASHGLKSLHARIIEGLIFVSLAATPLGLGPSGPPLPPRRAPATSACPGATRR